jgi:hypothetical protein
MISYFYFRGNSTKTEFFKEITTYFNSNKFEKSITLFEKWDSESNIFNIPI